MKLRLPGRPAADRADDADPTPGSGKAVEPGAEVTAAPAPTETSAP